ncbi:DUF3592 domain-containing protein [Crossiella sp. NPDC003009]
MGNLSSRRPPAWLFGLVGAIVIGGFAWAAYQVWSNDQALAERGQRAMAKVVDTNKRDEVEFRTQDGRQVRALIGQRLSGSAVAVGEEIEIVYDPADPTSDVDDARATGDRSFAYLMSAITIFAAAAISAVTWHLARMSRTKVR